MAAVLCCQHSASHHQVFIQLALIMSLDRQINACFCSWGRESGFISVPVRDIGGGGFDVVFVDRYFGSRADVAEHTVFVTKNDLEPDCRLQLLVFFDRNLHANGTQRCPYLAIKISEGDRADNLTRAEYILVVAAIDE
jgi:hypothetical protein